MLAILVILAAAGAVWAAFSTRTAGVSKTQERANAALPAFPLPSAASVNSPARSSTPVPSVVVISPHFDDAVLSLGGLLARDHGRSLVVTVFTGEPSSVLHTVWDARSGFKNSHEAIMARRKENATALAALEASTDDLGFLDYQYRRKGGDAGLQDVLTRALAAVVRTYVGSATPVSFYGPAIFGPKVGHPDHKLLHEAFLRVADEFAGTPNLSFFVYEDFPYIAHAAPKVRADYLGFLERVDRRAYRTVPIAFGADTLTEKVAAILDYRSQDALVASDIGSLARVYDSSRCKDLRAPDVACEMTYLVLPKR